MAVVRTFVPSDSEALAACAVACGQTGEVSAESFTYHEFISMAGTFVVSESKARILGFAGRVDRAGAAFLTDLFVRPDEQDRGLGRQLLEAVWGGTGQRMTSASQDPRALSLYSHFGATPRWRNLYLEIDGCAAVPNERIVSSPATPGDCGWDFPVSKSESVALMSSNGEVEASAVIAVDPSTRTLQILRAVTPQSSSLPLLVDHLRGLVGPQGVVLMNIPEVHPALGALGEVRIVDADIWCADDSSASAIDPTRELPSPAFG